MKILGQSKFLIAKNHYLQNQNIASNQSVFISQNNFTNSLRMNVLTKDTISFSGIMPTKAITEVVEKTATAFAKKTMKNIPKDLRDKKVFIKVDHNLPFDINGEIADDTRIRESLPTIIECINRNAKIIIATHIGDPFKISKGKLKEKLIKTDKITERLGELLEEAMGEKIKIYKSDDVVGPHSKELKNQVKNREIVYLENVRREPGEKGKTAILNETTGEYEEQKVSKDVVEKFAKDMADDIDIYINDAFASAHRGDSSNKLMTEFVKGPKVAGFLLEKEMKHGNKILNPQRPFAAIIGGSKVSSKAEPLGELAKQADIVIVSGGGMAHTFTLAKGGKVGESLVEEDQIETAREIMKNAKVLILPEDVVAADRMAEDANTQIVDAMDIPKGWQGLDIGPKSIARIKEALKGVKTIFVNGPPSVYEMDKFKNGTDEMAKAIIESGVETVVGGGDMVAAFNKVFTELGIDVPVQIDISTGGGAFLDLLAKGKLPAIEALDNLQPIKEAVDKESFKLLVDIEPLEVLA